MSASAKPALEGDTGVRIDLNPTGSAKMMAKLSPSAANGGAHRNLAPEGGGKCPSSGVSIHPARAIGQLAGLWPAAAWLIR